MKISSLLTIAILLLCFVLGGPLQFLGVLSLTQSNYIAICLIAFYLISTRIQRKVARSELLLLFLWVYIVCGIFTNGSSLAGISVYTYYLICPLIAARFASRVVEANYSPNSNSWYRFIAIFLLLQLVTASAQVAMAAQLVSMSAINVSIQDVVSGTFYMKSDNSLSAFCLIASILTLWSNSPTRTKTLVSATALGIVALANSKVFQQITPIFLFAAIVQRTLLQGKYRSGWILVLAVAGAILALCIQSFAVEKAGEFVAYVYEMYDFRYGDNMADRLAPFGEMIYAPTSYFGQGALTYYNPLTKEWYYNAGFSLVYSLYFDYGVIGLLLVIGYFLCLTLEHAGFSIRAMTLFAVFISFCVFSPTLTDLSFLIAYVAACKISRISSEMSASRQLRPASAV